MRTEFTISFGQAHRGFGVAQEHRAAVFFGHFIDRAAHVDVDDRGAVVLVPIGLPGP